MSKMTRSYPPASARSRPRTPSKATFTLWPAPSRTSTNSNTFIGSSSTSSTRKGATSRADHQDPSAETRAVDGFRQVIGRAELAQAAVVVFDGDHEHRDACCQRIRLERAKHVVATSIGQTKVEDDRGRRTPSYRAECRRRVGRDLDALPALAHDGREELGVACVIFDDEHARPELRRADHDVIEQDPEARALAFLALEIDRSMLQLDELLRDGESESGPGSVHDALVQPFEHAEYPLSLVRRDPDALVRDLEAQVLVLYGDREPYDAALAGELHRIREQVEEDLSDPARVKECGPCRDVGYLEADPAIGREQRR